VFSWQYLSHADAVYCAYESGEDGLLGVCDDHGELCLALALWNGKDHILKERLFGLSGPEVSTVMLLISNDRLLLYITNSYICQKKLIWFAKTVHWVSDAKSSGV